jgi:soluble lytic murein transglycosylase
MFVACKRLRLITALGAMLIGSVLPLPAFASESIDSLVTGSIDPAATTAPRPVSLDFLKALKLFDAKDYAGAYDLARSIADDTQRRTIQWLAIYFGDGDVDSDSVLRYEADAPKFASASLFRTRLEQALVKEKASAPQVIKQLGGQMPNTVDAQVALAEAYVEDGQTARAARIARSIWTENYLDEQSEGEVLDKLGSLLTRDDHWARAMHLMMNDRASAVERLLKYLSPAQKSLAVARNAVSRNDKNAKSLLDNVDPSMKTNPVYYFSRAERARQFELWDDAAMWLGKAKGDLPDAGLFWYERQSLVRQLLALGEIKKAYTVAAGYTHGPEGRLVEARFHAGWIALSFLREPKLALPQFEAMRKLSTMPDSISQSSYWLGRTRAELGDAAGAREAYRDAARYGTVYYGELARQALGLPAVALRTAPDWQDDVAGFESNELVRAVRLLADNGHDSEAAALLGTFATGFQSGGELLLAARLAQSVDAHHLAIDIAGAADKRGIALDLFSFPKDGLPSTRLASIDRAAIYAVARQESHFKVDAISSAGARGLMQLMPATAKETAGRLGVSYSASRLTSDPAYNALLGSSYLKTQLDSFDNSLLLAAAAYNAGAGNARKWIRTFGDPRSEKIDPIVWVELIPFSETRKYVQRVLGNYLVYRTRLGQDEMTVEQALRRIPG